MDEQLFKLARILKADYGACGIKIEFENEFLTNDECNFLKKVATKAGLDLVVKIGGCGSMQDMISAKTLLPHAIVAPMIESRYALEKFYKTANVLMMHNICDLYFNIETVVGFQNLDEILKSSMIEKFKGVVFGRSDFCESFGQQSRQIDPEETIEYVNTLSRKIDNKGLELIVGGNVTQNSVSYLRVSGCKKFETRKIIFDRSSLEKNITAGLNLALEFEIQFLKSKEVKTEVDKYRIAEVTRRQFV